MDNTGINHSAIFVDSKDSLEYKTLFGKSDLKEILLYSEVTIRELVEQEAKRDTSVIIEREGQSLRTMSSGERKVAVFNYLISRKPKSLIIENFHENLDPINRSIIDSLLVNVSKEINIIQVVRKQRELFSFIHTFFIVSNRQLIQYKANPSSFFVSKNRHFSEFIIPESPSSYFSDHNTFVKLSDVTIKFFEKTVLKNINWEIKLGEFWQLIGENGSGKTTLLSLITGDSHKAYGQNIVLFDKLKGTEENVWEIKQKIGYFTPNITELFNRRHSVLHMVLSGFYDSIGLYVKPLDIHIKLAHQWLELIGLTEYSNATFMTLPLSKQRMVLIARAMVKHPPLLILDEPTSGLDIESTQLIVALINKISLETKTTIIYVSHSLEDGLSADKRYKLLKTSCGSLGEVV